MTLRGGCTDTPMTRSVGGSLAPVKGAGARLWPFHFELRTNIHLPALKDGGHSNS